MFGSAGPVSDNDAPHISHRLVQAAQIGAAGLIGFGLILFIAANWNDISRVARFAIAGGAVLIAGFLAMLLGRARVPGALLALAGIGGLLALVGITYQTGGDPWQLFALWAALSLPLAFAARHDAVWTAWVLVVATALPLWVFANTGWVPRVEHTTIIFAHWLMTEALAVLVSPWTGIETWIGQTRWAFRLATTVLLGVIAKDAVGAAFGFGTLSLVYFAALVALAALIAGLAVARPFDFALLAVAALAADVVLIAGLWRISEPILRRDILGFLVVGAASAGIVIGSVRLLLSIGDDVIARFKASTSAASAEGQVPVFARWPTILLSAVGAVFAAIPFLAVYGILFGSALASSPIAIVIGLATLAAGVWLGSGGPDYGFRQIFGLIALVTGGAVTGYGLLATISPAPTFIVGTLIATGLALVVRARWISALLGLVAGLCACAAVLVFIYPRGLFAGPPLIPLMVTTLAGLALLVVLTRPEAIASVPADIAEKGTSYGLGWTTAMLFATIWAAGPTFLLGTTFNSGAVSALKYSVSLLTVTPARVLSLALTLGAAVLLLSQRPALRTPTGYALAALAVVLSYLSPTFSIALAVGAVMLGLGHRAIATFAAFVALWCLGSLYYWVGIPLAQKAMLLAALGLVLGLVTLFDRRPGGADDSVAAVAVPRARQIAAPLLIAVSLLATGGMVGAAIVENEAIVRNGRPVYIALAPVDPRSLMQGDYMALRFTLPPVPSTLAHERELQAVARIDERNIATVTRIELSPAKLAVDETRINLTYKRNWIIATDAFYFPEGQGKVYEQARFGEFRLRPNGSLLLIGLADKDLVGLGR